MLNLKNFLLLIVILTVSGCHGNRSTKQITHPITNQTLTLLVLGGISKDYTYLIEGEYNSTYTPKSVNFVVFRDSFGISYNDTSWVVYYLGDIVEELNQQKMNIVYKKLENKFEYRHLIDSTKTDFVYRYYF